MERLYAEFLLWKHGFHSREKYEELLNAVFLDDFNNGFLLELEDCSSNILGTSSRFLRYWDYEHPELDIHIFGKHVFSGLKHAYNAKAMSIEKFGKHCYSLWQDLPLNIGATEPFWALCYADDPLSWGDEAQTRSLFEKAFAFYD